MIHLVTLFGALGLLVSSPVLQGKPASDANIVHVFVKTESTSDHINAALWRKSIDDVAAAMGQSKKLLTLVTRDADGDVALELIERTVVTPKVVVGLPSRPNDPMPGMNPVRTILLRVKLTTTGRTLEFENKNKPYESDSGWRAAAQDVANQVVKWIDGHRAELLKR